MLALLTLAPGAAASSVPTVTLNNGVEMPVVGAGTWEYNSTTAYDSVKEALSLGYTHIDTANDYKNQDGVGRALAEFDRNSYFLTSKIPGCGLQGVSILKCYEDTKSKFEENLSQLGLDQVDLMLVHFPPVDGCSVGCKGIQDQWRAMEEMYKANKSRAIGVSNYCQSCLNCLNETATVVPQVNQFQMHVGMGPDPESLVSDCRARGIAPQAYSPLGDGSSELIHGNVTGSIGAKYNKSSVQVSLKWVVQTGLAVVTKASRPDYLADDIALFDFNLTADDMSTLDAMTKPSGKVSFLCSK